MKVGIIGVGYVGLVTGVMFADQDNEVYCMDIDKDKIDDLNNNKIPIYEPGLDELVQRANASKKIIFTTDLALTVKESEVIFIAVGTPSDEDGSADLKYVLNVASEIGKIMTDYKVIVDKSTVPVGTADLVRSEIEKQLKIRNLQINFDVASNPEFLREGTAVKDTFSPDRIVLGVSSREAKVRLLELYAPLESPILITDIKSAEIIKYASNAFLSVKISFINMVADLCEVTGADVEMVAKGMGYDKRIGYHFLMAGLGYGGSCFPKDTRAFLTTAKQYNIDFPIVEAAVNINVNRIEHFLKRIMNSTKELKDKTIGIWGLSFKPNTDDLREAKSLELIPALLETGAKVRAYDPLSETRDNVKKMFPKVHYSKNPYDAAKDVDILIIITEWAEFNNIDFFKLYETMKTPLIFDGRNMYKPEKMKELGFEYHSIGRSTK